MNIQKKIRVKTPNIYSNLTKATPCVKFGKSNSCDKYQTSNYDFHFFYKKVTPIL